MTKTSLTHVAPSDESRSATSPTAPVGDVAWSALRHQFDYVRQPIEVVERGSWRREGAVVHDISYAAPGQSPVNAYLVCRERPGHFPGTMFLHWLGESHADRSQFLDEAVALAGEGPGRVSLLPHLDFPFAHRPVGDIRDKDSVVKQVIQLRRGLDLLQQRRDVVHGGLVLVGHDYGGMYAALLGAVDRPRVHQQVVIAADATFAHWFVRFFLDVPDLDVLDYAAMLDTVDPIHYVARGPRGGTLLQYATSDFYVPAEVADLIAETARPRARRLVYDCDHELAVPEAAADRGIALAEAGPHPTTGALPSLG
jgi:pimeloyl-ACP methyl ester carboxylesterase